MDGSLLLRCRCRRSRAITNSVAREHQLHAPVLLPAFRGIVRSDGLSLAHTFRGDLTCGNSLLNQVVPHCLCPSLRKLLVVVVATDAIRMTFDLKFERGICQYDSRNLREALARSRQKLKAAALKKHIR